MPAPAPGRPWGLSRAMRWNGYLALTAAGHVALGWALEPGWVFSKYPDAVALAGRALLGPETAADLSPGYLWLHTLLPPMGIRWLQGLLGSVAVVALAAAARRTSGPLAGYVVALVAALHPTLLAYEATLEPDLAIAALGCLALCAAAFARRGHTGPGQAALLLLGLAAALRPSEWLFLAAAVAWWTAWLWRHARRALPLGVAATVAASVLALAPVEWRRRQFGGERGATMSVGQVAYVGHRPEGTGFGATTPAALKLYERQLRSAERPDHAHALFRQFAQLATGGTGGVEAERYWLHKALEFARREPGAWASNLGRKARFFLAGPISHDIAPTQDLEDRARRWVPLEPSLLGLLGLAGLLLAAARGRRLGGLALGMAAGRLALVCVFYALGRYSLPWVIASLAGLGELARFSRGLFRSGRRPRTVQWALLAAWTCLLPSWFSLGALAHSLVTASNEGSAAAEAFRKARARGDERAARAEWVRAVGAQPMLQWTQDLVGFPPLDPELSRAAGADRVERLDVHSPMDRLLLAHHAVAAGRCDEVAGELASLAASGTTWAVFDLPLAPWTLQVTCALRRGDAGEAASAVDRALGERPGALAALAHSAVADRRLPGRQTGSLERLEALHDPVSVNWALGRAALEWGDETLARERTQLLLGQLPGWGLGWALWSDLLARAGREDESLAAFATACQLAPRQPLPVPPLEQAVNRVLSSGAATAGDWSVAGELAFRSGQWALARARWQKASALMGDAAPAWHRAWMERLVSP